MLEIGLASPPLCGNAARQDVIGPKQPYDPQFRLIIRDAKPGAVLWTLIEHVEWAICSRTVIGILITPWQES
jgi:hypothetical protein